MIRKLIDQIGAPGILVAWIEKRHARRASLGVLAVYWQERTAYPELSGKALYAQVVAAHSSTDEETAAMIVRQAEESFAEWPVRRELTFRDVVDYLVIRDYMRSNLGRHGTHSEMRRVIAETIPIDL